MRFSILTLLQASLFCHLCTARPQWQPWQQWSSGSWAPDYVLVATAKNITTNCLSRYSVVFNDTTPAPTLYLRENHTTWVRVYNGMTDQNFTTHWHGLSERLDIFSDGTPQVSQYPIAPQEYFDYAITPVIGDAGSYFYHSHVGFQAVTAAGPLIVEHARSDPAPYSYDEERIIFIQDFYNKNDSIIEAGLVANPFVWSGEPEAIVFNGKSGNHSFSNATDDSYKPDVITVEPGKTYRMRFISMTALSLVTLGIEDHSSLTIIGADGQYSKPWTTDHLQLGSGQRYSVLFTAKNASELQSSGKSSFWLRYENRDRPTNVSGYALLQYNTSSSVTYPPDLPDKSPVTLPQNVTSWAEYSLTPLSTASVAAFPPLSTVTRTVYITMRQIIRDGFYNGSFHGILQWANNDLVYQTESSQANHTTPYLVDVYTSGKTPNYTAAVANEGWDPNDNEHAFPALVGEVLDIVWLSNSGPTGGWDFHPMHAHGSHYYDLGSGNGTYNATENEKHFANYTPMVRDTTILHRYATSGEIETTAGWRAWRIAITEDKVGAWMLHCHILAHMAMGMQTVWVYGNTEQILARFPTEPFVNGYLTYGGDAYGNASYDPFVDGGYSRES